MSQRSDLVKRSVFPLCALEIYQFLISELQGNSVYLFDLFKDHKGTIKLTYLHHFSILTIPICFEIYILLNKNKKNNLINFIQQTIDSLSVLYVRGTELHCFLTARRSFYFWGFLQVFWFPFNSVHNCNLVYMLI